MDIINEIRDALIKLRSYAAGMGCDYQEPCTPGDYDVCQSCEHVDIANKALAAISTIDPDAIRREFWNELHAEAETQYDRRLELLGPIETLDDAALRKTLGDGWSAWLLAKKIIENRRAAILADEPAQDGYSCPNCLGTGKVLKTDENYHMGDECPLCSGGRASVKPAQDDRNPEEKP